MTIFNAFITEEYEDKNTGEVKTSFTRVGTAFPHKKGNGFNLVIPDGLAISGRVLITERKNKDDQPDAEAANAFNDQQ